MSEQILPGGRLPLLMPSELSREQEELYNEFKNSVIPWANDAGFKTEAQDGSLLGPLNAYLYNPALGAALYSSVNAEQSSTSLSPQLREVVILTVGAVWSSAYELYAHRAVAKKVGIGDNDIEALATGKPPRHLGEAAALAHRFVHAITKQHAVSDDLFKQAAASFGHKGLVDMLYLTGQYMTVAALLNSFAVPVPASSETEVPTV